MMLLCTFISCSSSDNKGIDIDGFFSDKDYTEYVNVKSWIVPDLTGYSCAEVTNVLDKIGQKYEVIFNYDENENVNAITGQDPACGGKVQKDKSLKLSVNNYYAKSNSITVLYSYNNPIAETGKCIYFTDGTSIYKSCDDYKSCEKIYSLKNSQKSIVSIIPRDEVFFLVKDSFEFSIYAINTDGKDNRMIYGPEYCMDFYASGDDLYMLSGDVLICYNIPRNQINVTDSEFQSYSYLQYNRDRYYIKAGETKGRFSMHKYNTEDNSDTTLFESDKNIATDVCLFNNSIYYICYSNNNNDPILCIDEWLYKYDLNTGENTLIEKIGDDQFVADNNQLFVWAGRLIVANADRIIKVDLKNNTCENVKTNRPEKLDYAYSIICGNYVYNYSYQLEDGRNVFFNGRYNLLTDEYEDFDWKKICN